MKIEHDPLDDEFLYKVFHGRCPKCKQWAVTIHELIPRSRGKRSMEITNRTPICARCHEEFHHYGASSVQIDTWHGIIKQYLESIGTWEQYAKVDG